MVMELSAMVGVNMMEVNRMGAVTAIRLSGMVGVNRLVKS